MALTKYNYNSFDVTPVASKAMGFNSGANGLASISPTSMILIKSVTASSDDTLSFINGTSDVVLDGTYPIYLFQFINIHPETNNVDFTFQVDTGTNTSYNQAMTTTVFRGLHDEANTAADANYDSGRDQAQGTAFQILAHEIGNGNDENMSGSLYLFNPANTTFVKHFMSTVNIYAASDMSENKYTAGYVNTTTAFNKSSI